MQFFYRNRKRAFGDFKKEMWLIPEPNRQAIMEQLEERVSLLFEKLNVVNTRDMVNRSVVA